MSCRIISSIIELESELDNERDINNNPIIISKSTVWRILKDHYDKPMKLRKLFYFLKSIWKKNYFFEKNMKKWNKSISIDEFRIIYIPLLKIR